MDALVADAHLPNALAGIRALGRAGVRVHAAAPCAAAPGLWSRYTASRSRTSDPLTDPEGLVAALAEKGRRSGPLVAYVGQEASIDALLDRFEGLPREVVLPYPAAEPLHRLRNKGELPELAEKHGLRAPATLARGTVADIRAGGAPTPSIVKPELATARFPTARAVHRPGELEALLADLPPEQPVVVQEAVAGDLSSLAVVLDREGAIVAAFQERARRTWPPAAGSFALTMSEAVDRDLADRVASMLSDVAYWGLAQVDFIRRADGVVVLDVNPRFYACMPLASACGVNLPAAWHAVVEGSARADSSRSTYPIGVAYRWLEGDLYAARHGDPGWLMRREPRTRAGAVWSRDDPLAAALATLDAVSLPLRRRARTWRR